MQITKDWLNKNIKTYGKGMLNLSAQQFKLLYTWFPDLFVQETNGTINIKSGWADSILKRTLSEQQSKEFYEASLMEKDSKASQSRHIKFIIKNAFDVYEYRFNKKLEKQPHTRLVSLIGHIEDVDLFRCDFLPDGTTFVHFNYAINDELRTFVVRCEGTPMQKNGKVVYETTLFEDIKPTFYGEEKTTKELKDCTGLDIVSCITDLAKKRKVVIVRKKKPMVFTSNTPEEIWEDVPGQPNAKRLNSEKLLEYETSQTAVEKEKEYKQSVKMARKYKIQMFAKTDMERIRDLFLDDWKLYSDQEKAKGNPEVSIKEFAELCNVDIKNPLSLIDYKGMPNDKRDLAKRLEKLHKIK